MNILLFLILIFAAFFPALGYPQAKNIPSQAEKQKVKDPYAWDFGRAKRGEVLGHKFILKNESQKTLNIKEARASCGCTVARIEKKVLLPGEAACIEVKFNTKGYSGAVQQFVYVNTDSADNPVLKLTIKANIVKK